MKRRTMLSGISALLISLVVFSAAPLKAASTHVEPGSTIYRDLEFLSARGLAPSLFEGILPISLDYLNQVIEEARRKAGLTGTISPAEERAMDRIEKYLARAGYWVDSPQLEKLSVEYSHLDEEVAIHPGPGISAEQKPLTYNRNGREYGKQTAFFDASISWNQKFFALEAKPLLTWKVSDPSDENFTLERGYIIFGSSLALEVGKDNRWWGQGRHGAILLTNNAESFPLASVRTSQPFELPLLGKLAFDTFLARLERDREFPHPYLFGAKVSIKPSPWLEIGLERAGTFGGEGAPEFDLEDFFRVFILTRSDKNENKSNQIAGFDLRVHLFSIGTDLYWERAGEHHFSHFPFSGGEANLWGIYVSDLFGLSLRGEYFDSTNEGRVWYRHGVFTSGYTYRGKVLGHHAGGDSRDFFFEVYRELSETASVTGSFDFERRGISLSNPETRRQVGGSVSFRIKNLRITLSGIYEKVDNLNFTGDTSDDNALVSIAIDYLIK